MDEQHPAAAFLEWLYDQGYEVISRGRLLDKKDPALSRRIHTYCLDQLEAEELIDEWREANGETIEYPPDENITPSA